MQLAVRRVFLAHAQRVTAYRRRRQLATHTPPHAALTPQTLALSVCFAGNSSPLRTLPRRKVTPPLSRVRH